MRLAKPIYNKKGKRVWENEKEKNHVYHFMYVNWGEKIYMPVVWNWINTLCNFFTEITAKDVFI